MQIALLARSLLLSLAKAKSITSPIGTQLGGKFSSKSGLNEALEDIAKACTPTREDIHKRATLIDQIQESITGAPGSPNLRVSPFGSFVSGLYNSKSDLDLVLHGLVPESRGRRPKAAQSQRYVPLHKAETGTQSRVLARATACLLTTGLARRQDVVYLTGARIPLVKFAAAGSGVAVDLVAGSSDAAFKAWSVAQVASIHPAFGKLFRVVKLWAKAHGINDGASHTFNSWCLTLVVMFYLQRHAQPPLLPPLHALLHDIEPPLEAPRLMQHGAGLPAELAEPMQRRVAAAREAYGSRPCPPLEELFRGFLTSGAQMLRASLEGMEPLARPTGVSAFYGDYRPCGPYNPNYLLYVEDPYNSADNTARTFHRQVKSSEGTLQHVISVFEQTARRLNDQAAVASQDPSAFQDLSASFAPSCSPLDPSATTFPSSADFALSSSTFSSFPSSLDPSFPSSGDLSFCSSASKDLSSSSNSPAGHASSSSAADPSSSLPYTSIPSSSPFSAPSSAPSSAPYSSPSPSPSPSPAPPTLASTLAFLFGTELPVLLPELSEHLLGPKICAAARGALAAGRPPGEVHTDMLKSLGAADGFATFESFKRRHNIRVLNEEKYATPEEKAASAERVEKRRAARAEAQRERARQAGTRPDASGRQEQQQQHGWREGEASAVDGYRQREMQAAAVPAILEAAGAAACSQRVEARARQGTAAEATTTAGQPEVVACIDAVRAVAVRAAAAEVARLEARAVEDVGEGTAHRMQQHQARTAAVAGALVAAAEAAMARYKVAKAAAVAGDASAAAALRGLGNTVEALTVAATTEWNSLKVSGEEAAVEQRGRLRPRPAQVPARTGGSFQARREGSGDAAAAPARQAAQSLPSAAAAGKAGVAGGGQTGKPGTGACRKEGASAASAGARATSGTGDGGGGDTAAKAKEAAAAKKAAKAAKKARGAKAAAAGRARSMEQQQRVAKANATVSERPTLVVVAGVKGGVQQQRQRLRRELSPEQQQHRKRQRRDANVEKDVAEILAAAAAAAPV